MSKDSREIFNFIDKNKDGKISLEEIDRLCEVIGENFLNEDIQKLMISIDPTFSDNFDFQTFQMIMDRKVFKEMKSDDLIKAFKVFDKNGIGRINTQDFHKVIESVALENNYLSSEEISEFVDLADPKRQGSFNYAEFIKNLG